MNAPKEKTKYETVHTLTDDFAGVEVRVTMNPAIKNPLHRYVIRPFTIIKPKDRAAFSVSGYQPQLTMVTYGAVALAPVGIDAMTRLIGEAEIWVLDEVQKVVDGQVEERRLKDEERANFGKKATRQTGKTARVRDRKAGSR